MEKFYKKNKNAENIEILGEYENNKTKIKCRCKIDEYEWSATPHSLLDGKIETKYVIDYLNRIQFFGFSLDSTATSSISEKTMFEIPAVNKRKKELENQYASHSHFPDSVF